MNEWIWQGIAYFCFIVAFGWTISMLSDAEVRADIKELIKEWRDRR